LCTTVQHRRSSRENHTGYSDLLFAELRVRKAVAISSSVGSWPQAILAIFVTKIAKSGRLSAPRRVTLLTLARRRVRLSHITAAWSTK
ncbi:MAG: hypothetical protein WB713_03195, partial [Methyloceanibacter sp.]